MAVGTSSNGGSGTTPRVEQAVLLLWDYENEENVWEGSPERSVAVFNALTVAPDGQLIGTVNGTDPGLFVFDAAARCFTNWIDLPDGRPLDLGLQTGSDGAIYGFTSQCFYWVDLSAGQIEQIFNAEISVAGPIVGQDVYFGDGCVLKSVSVF